MTEVRDRDLLKCFTDMVHDHILIEQGSTDRIRSFYLKHKDRQVYGRMQSTYFLFTPEGIIITGDLCPGNDSRNSGVHAFGYDLHWFAGRLSESYLCEKFLTESWHADLAGEWCHNKACDIIAGKHDDDFKALKILRDKRHLTIEEIGDLRSDLRTSADDEKGGLIEMLDKSKKEAAQLREELRRGRLSMADEYHRLGEYIGGGDEGSHYLRDELWRLERFEASDGMPGYDYDPRSRCLLVAIQKRFAECYWESKAKAETSIGSVDLSTILPGGIL